MFPDLKFDMNRSACLIINQNPVSSLPAHKSSHSLGKPASSPTKTYLTFQDSYTNPVNSQTTSSAQKTKPWYTNVDINGSYPESDYHSLSTANNSHSHISSYSSIPKSANHHRTLPGSPNYDYYSPVYSENHLSYRSNSVREDDETTTTSGSYTINHDDVDVDVELSQRQYQMSQVV